MISLPTLAMLIVIGALLFAFGHWYLLALLITMCLLHGWQRGNSTTN